MTGLPSAPPAPSPVPPLWPHCGVGAQPATDPVGCRGVQVGAGGRCLIHLEDADRDAYLAGLGPGSAVDGRGTAYTTDLLRTLLRRLRDAETDYEAHFGSATFDEAVFPKDASFVGVTFSGPASFQNVTFTGGIGFERATFRSDATFAASRFRDWAQFHGVSFHGRSSFNSAVFSGDAWFHRALFTDTATFSGATFTDTAGFLLADFRGDVWFPHVAFRGEASFTRAEFGDDAWFTDVTFGGDTAFERAVFHRHAWFHNTTFAATAHWGPALCGGTLDLSRARFARPVVIEAAAHEVRCHLTRWESTASLRLRHATVDLRDTLLTHPLSLTTHRSPFTDIYGRPLDQPPPDGRDPRVRVASLAGVDAAQLVLTDVDLSECRFAGTVRLDQLRWDGECVFAATPTGLHRHGLVPARWTRRRTLAEEQYWRAAQAPAGSPPPPRGWTSAPEDAEPVGPAGLAALYRQLGAARRRAGRAADAADFWYGEAELRRRDPDRPRGERVLFALYWALSGYGLRATRALGWLLLTVVSALFALMLWGLPTADTAPSATGPSTSPSTTSSSTGPGTPGAIGRAADPYALSSPVRERLSAERGERALRVVSHAVVFRSSGQRLTTVGLHLELVCRLVEPVLLGCAGFALRGRVTR